MGRRGYISRRVLMTHVIYSGAQIFQRLRQCGIIPEHLTSLDIDLRTDDIGAHITICGEPSLCAFGEECWDFCWEAPLMSVRIVKDNPIEGSYGISESPARC